jgi:hypothetical protein
LERFPESATVWKHVQPGRGKGDDIHIAPWYCYIRGQNEDYPQRILGAQWTEVTRRMNNMWHDDGDPEEWDVHHWQDINPVHTEALVQLSCGGPQIIYHGGLLHVRLRYYDAIERRPGLPDDVSALVHALDAGSTSVTLTNTSPLHERRLIIQAGAFGEHNFTGVTEITGEQATPQGISGKYLPVVLPPGHSVDLRLDMQRYANPPSYNQPAF